MERRGSRVSAGVLQCLRSGGRGKLDRTKIRSWRGGVRCGYEQMLEESGFSGGQEGTRIPVYRRPFQELLLEGKSIASGLTLTCQGSQHVTDESRGKKEHPRTGEERQEKHTGAYHNGKEMKLFDRRHMAHPSTQSPPRIQFNVPPIEHASCRRIQCCRRREAQPTSDSDDEQCFPEMRTKPQKRNCKAHPFPRSHTHAPVDLRFDPCGASNLAKELVDAYRKERSSTRQ